MDIEKNQRLIKFSNLIKDMVNYKEISDYLLQSRVISLSDHTELVETVEKTGNSSAMEHLTHVLGLRRGGYNALIGALRQNDYHWLADQMDPQPQETSTSPKGILPALAYGFKKRKSRTSERLSADTIFTSYRPSIPMDLNTQRPKSTGVVLNEMRSSKGNILEEIPSTKFISASLDNLKLDAKAVQHSQAHLNNAEEFNMECHNETTSTTTNTECHSSTQGKSAIIYNIPESEKSRGDMELVSNIARRFEFPTECLQGLKASRIGRISKQKSSNSVRPLKVKFKSTETRDKFIKIVKEQLTSALLDPEIANIDVVPYEKNSRKSSKSKGKSEGPFERNLTAGRPHWFSRANLFSSLKSTNKSQE